MRSTLNDSILTLYIEGRVDTTNAEAVRTEIEQALQAQPHDALMLDIAALEYISSAGLRVILHVRKSEPEMKVINASAEVYDIFEMTGFTEMMTVEKAYRTMCVDGCDVLGQGSNGIVYRYSPELVVKVYRNPDAIADIKKERELARKALILGIPTAIPFDVVKVGDRFASVFELLNASSFSKLIRENMDDRDRYIRLFSDLLEQIHATEVSPSDMPDMKAIAVDWAGFLKDHLPEAAHAKLMCLMEAVPDRNTMIHGDYHTNNVEMQNGEVLLIDMDTLSHGHPVFEFASMYLGFVGFGELDNTSTEKFLGLDYDTTRYIWHRTLINYLHTEDPARIDEVSKKAQVVGYTRLLRRTIRRESDTEYGQKLIAHCKEKLISLLETVDTLTF